MFRKPTLFLSLLCLSVSNLLYSEIIEVSASASQSGNGPEHAIDGSVNSRWSAEGKDQWLQLKLDKKATFSTFEAGFSRGSRNYDDRSLELYDLHDDLSEKRNLAKESPEVAKRLNQKLSQWLKETNAPMPTLNSNP